MKFRSEILAMHGYTPGEQPKSGVLVKLNTNENPYPPSPRCEEVLRTFPLNQLRLYPNPSGETLRGVIANLHGLNPEQVLLGNGSDDILNLIVRALVGEGEELSMVDPSYSLYPTLTELQGAKYRKISLLSDFSLPIDLAQQIAGSKLFMLPRPNAPTGNSFPIEQIRDLCRNFDGAVLIDEAYVDFADDHCVGLLSEFPNLIVCRTLSKSYALAGLRVGYALAAASVIEQLNKVKDSYNVGALPQAIAQAALEDQDYLQELVDKVKGERNRVAKELVQQGFSVTPSQSNFLFASPPDGKGDKALNALRSAGILVRYFNTPATSRHIRITIGTPEQNDQLLHTIRQLYPL